LEKFASLLTQFGEYVAKIDEPFPPITRDRNDDYLLAYAQVGAADYLVTGDKDLLALRGQVPGLGIVTPAQFVEILETNDLRP
jgi:predicted nucleic acid-binding protein